MALSSSSPADAVLAVLEGVNPENSAVLVDTVISTPGIKECYAYFKDPGSYPTTSGSAPLSASAAAPNAAACHTAAGGSSPVITAGDVNALAALLDAVAVSDLPRLRCVPLLGPAGWTLDRVASLPPVRVLLRILPPPAAAPATSRGKNPPTLAQQTSHPNHPNHPNHSNHPHQQQQQQTDLTAGPATAAVSEGCGNSHHHHLTHHHHGHLKSEADGGRGGGDAVTALAAPTSIADAVAAGTGTDSGGGGGSRGADDIVVALHRLRPRQLPGWETRTAAVPAIGPRGGAPAGWVGGGGGGGGGGGIRSGGGRNGNGCGTVPAEEPAPKQPQQPPQRYVTLVDGVPAPARAPLRFDRVAVGGTFDRLHAGHELLLATSALVAEGSVFVGVTADALLANKSHKDLLQPYDTRAQEAVSYMQAVRPGLQVESGPLCDPKAPTPAELDPAMEALVVSVETLPGAAAINAGRAARGFRPLTVITVPVIGIRGGGGGGAPPGQAAAAAAGGGFSSKLSSSGLRALEAAAAVGAVGGAAV